MDNATTALADALGRHVVDRSFSELRGLFAPWLEDLTDAALGSMLDEAKEGLPPPVSWTVDHNPIDLASLRAPSDFGPPSEPLPDEITDANFGGWVCVQFAPDPDNEDEMDVCFDVWFVPVVVGGELRIGYLEPWEAT